MRWPRLILALGTIVLLAACIGVSPGGEKAGVEVGEGVKVKVPSPEVVLPKEDVVGEDLSDVPRYSPSVRISYSKDTSYGVVFITIEYYTEDELSKVREFYLSEMPKHGWKAVGEEAQPGISLPFGGISIGESRLIDFRKQECTDPSTCLPYAKITLGSFKVGEKSYTYIGIDYEARAEGAPETAPPETAPPAGELNVEELVSALDAWIKPVLESASGGEVKLTNYQTERVTELSGLTLNYDLPQGVVDQTTMTVDPELHLRVAELLEAKPEVELVQAYDMVGNFVYVAEAAGPLRIGGTEVAFVRVDISIYQPIAMVDVRFPAQVDFGDEVVAKSREMVESRWLRNVSFAHGKTLELVSSTGTGYLTDGGMGKGYAAWLRYDVGHDRGAEILCGSVGAQGWWPTRIVGGCINVQVLTLEYGGQKLRVEVRSVARKENPREVVVAVHARTRASVPGVPFPLPGGG